MRQITVHAFRVAVCVALFGLTLARASSEAEVRSHLDLLRGVAATNDQAELKRLNSRMDEAWSFFNQHEADALPVIRQELKTAIEAKTPDQFFLLDIGFWLVRKDAAQSAGLAVAALERIDPQAKVTQGNWQELFQFVMMLGATGQEAERYLKQVDRIYLPNEIGVEFFAAPHWVKLNAYDLQCMIYGVAGEAAAAHLGTEAAKPGIYQARLMELLSALGSEKDTANITAILQTSRDYDVATADVTALMTIGGPTGRAAVLAYDGSPAGPKMQSYVKDIRESVKATGLAYFDRTLKEFSPSNKMSDQAVQQALDLMEKNNGADDSTSPVDILRSKLDPEKALAQMKRIRAVSFRRATNHVFEDLPVSNLLINALQFKRADAPAK